jgi:hypothetical protein
MLVSNHSTRLLLNVLIKKHIYHKSICLIFNSYVSINFLHNHLHFFPLRNIILGRGLRLLQTTKRVYCPQKNPLRTLCLIMLITSIS